MNPDPSHQSLDPLASHRPTEWMPREQWDALVRGEGCPLCRSLAPTERPDRHGVTIADLGISRLQLAVNQYVPGYCFLICNRHVSEVYHLTSAESPVFFDDLLRAARAIEQVYKPIKMNIQMLGNSVPHLHAHLIPRYYGDPSPGFPIEPTAQLVCLDEAEYTHRVQAILHALNHPNP